MFIEHVHKYEAVFGYFVDIWIVVKKNDKIVTDRFEKPGNKKKHKKLTACTACMPCLKYALTYGLVKNIKITISSNARII